ncbi:MAG: hypothetical protein CMG41_01790 [Candidatus Marinimicrobia bacterium]|nr:hypothetical protein [Candidatus Neomarinimicrobiota bacterium]|tara:strand:- start:270 stop:629 length:360 start_codon:yes stop_codon:yes gene_type:complete
MNSVKFIILFIFIGYLYGQVPDNINEVVYKQMLILKSKLIANPISWQDTREGYLRNRAARVCDLTLDSLETVNAIDLIGRYYPELDSLLIKINDGKEYEVVSPPYKNYQINYFYSSSKP